MIVVAGQDFATGAPLLVLSATAVAALVLDTFVGTHRTRFYWVAAVLHVVVAVMVSRLDTAWPFSASAVTDGLFRLMAASALIGNAAILVLWTKDKATGHSIEPLVLTTLASVGVVGLTMANDLLVLVVAFEVVSLALYTLAGATRTAESTEASLKYFLLGAFTFSFMALGTAYIFGATGSTNFNAIASRIAFLSQEGRTLLTLGVGLLLVGMAFELMLAPFHLWGPDVIQGAATPASAAIAVLGKLAALAALARFLMAVVPSLEQQWSVAMGALSVLSLLVGNLGALRQRSLKRLLAYSSISHAGFLGLALISNLSATAFYAVAYALSTLGAFSVVTALEAQGIEDPAIEDLAGLASENPLLAGSLGLFVASLAGVPLTAGFMAKLGLLVGLWQRGYIAMAIVAALASAIGFYYYFRVVSASLAPKNIPKPSTLGTSLWIVLGFTFLAILILGLVPVFPTGLLAIR
jgi:NADH-quinone oxidoreductase subunit N